MSNITRRILTLSLILGQISPAIADTTDAFQFFEEEANSVSLATMIKQPLKDAPADVTVVTEDEIKNMGARNLSDVLETVAGIDITQSANYNDSNIGIHGLTLSGNEVKVMINGHTLTSFAGGPFNKYFNFIPLQNIRKIEIVKGPGSALYGTGAFLGVINIITKDEVDDQKRAEVTQQYGSYNTVKDVLEVAPQKGDFKGYFMGSFNRSDGPRLNVDSDEATQLFGSRFSEAPGTSAANYTDYTVQSNMHYRDFYLTGFFNKQSGADPIGIASALANDSAVDMHSSFVEGGYKKRAFNDGQISYRAYYDNFWFNPTFEVFGPPTASLFSILHPTTPYPNGEGIYGNPSGREQTIGNELTVDNQVFPALHLLGGASFETLIWNDIQQITNGDTIGAPLTLNGITYQPLQYLGGSQNISSVANWSVPAERNTASVYSQGTLDIRKLCSLEATSSELSLTSGVRYDHYNDVGGSVNPSAAIVYSPVERLSWKTIYGTAFRAPSMQELYSINNPTHLGNPNLSPETIQTVESQVGYEFTRALKGSLDVFDSRTHNLITFNLNPQGILEAENEGKINSDGIETEFKYSLSPTNYAYVNGTYQYIRDVTHQTITSPTGASYTQGDFNPGGNPAIIANAGLNYELTPHIMPNLSVNYIGNRPRTGQLQFNSNGVLVPVDPRDRLPARALVNLVTTFKDFGKLPGLELRFGIYNLFNTNYSDPDPTGALADDVPRPGINFMGDMSYRF